MRFAGEGSLGAWIHCNVKTAHPPTPFPTHCCFRGRPSRRLAYFADGISVPQSYRHGPLLAHQFAGALKELLFGAVFGLEAAQALIAADVAF